MSSRYAKEFHRLKQSLEKKTNGQAFIKDWDPDNITSFIVEVSPQGGPYKQGKFLFQIIVPELYPDVHPDVVCLTDIYHPNIDSDITDEHNICLNLFDEWNKSFGLEDCVQGLIFLLYNPNLTDPISSFFDGSVESQAAFFSKVQASLRGESFDGISFAKNPGYVEMEASEKETEKEEKESRTSPLENNAEETIKDKMANNAGAENGIIEKDTDGAKKEENSEVNGATSIPESNRSGLLQFVSKVEVATARPDAAADSDGQVDSSPEDVYCSADEHTNDDMENGDSECALVPANFEKPLAADLPNLTGDTVAVEQSVKVSNEEPSEENQSKEEEPNKGEGSMEEANDEKSNDEEPKDEESKDEELKDEESKDEELKDEESKEEKPKEDESSTEERKDKEDADEDEEEDDEENVFGAIAENANIRIHNDGWRTTPTSSCRILATSSEEEEDDDPLSDSSEGSTHANYLPYEEADFSWTGVELNEDTPFVDALGCRFLYANQSDSDADDADFDSDVEGFIDDDDSDEDEDDGEEDDLTDDLDDLELDLRGGGEIIDLDTSRIIIRPVRRRTGRHHHHRRRRTRCREIVVEERDPGLLWPLARRTLAGGVSVLRPYFWTVWPELDFWEVGALWTLCVWLSGSFAGRRRIARRVLR